MYENLKTNISGPGQRYLVRDMSGLKFWLEVKKYKTGFIQKGRISVMSLVFSGRKDFSVTDIESASRVRVIKNLAHTDCTQVSQGVEGWLGWSQW